MDASESLLNHSGPTILTLPGSDLDENCDSKPDLVLLQLPANWDVSNLENAKLVGSQNEQVALITENQSFLVHKVETSNALIMVPPHAKRSKTNSGLASVSAQLLKPGGSGASFLELRAKKLDRTLLLQQLPMLDVYDPTASAAAGKAIEELSVRLQASADELKTELRAVGAYEVDGKYSILCEEAKINVESAILSGLAEIDDANDYATKGVNDAFASQVATMMGDHETYSGVETGIRHCLDQLKVPNTSTGRDRIVLDVSKVRVLVTKICFHLTYCFL